MPASNACDGAIDLRFGILPVFAGLRPRGLRCLWMDKARADCKLGQTAIAAHLSNGTDCWARLREFLKMAPADPRADAYPEAELDWMLR